MKTLDREATKALLPYDRLVPALRQMMLDRRQGLIHAPQRTVLPLPDEGAYLAMSACDAQLAITKLVAVTPANRGRELPTLHGTVIVTDAHTGRTLCTLDGPTLTARRTAAVTLLGVGALLARTPRRVALIGTGAQAHEHAAAVQQRWAPETLWAVGRSLERSRAFAQELRGIGVDVQPADRVDALAACDVVICLTTSREPVLPEHLAPEMLVAGVGAFTPAMAEIPPGIARAAQVVVDDLPGAREEAGDLQRAGIAWDSVLELADCLVQRPDTRRRWVLKTVGHASWDLAAARTAIGS
ncbi:delta(1)-pyrroline-2-carboxylate reductase family protein [Piscinibacter sp.]|uniref:delta(1)-pyrroline-2-carboxylate reductase family protein n=1 Tax=Piscinibacter sp. TaxID=1903157 RepID=UPI002CEE282D|nr:delta(1)-pyrroline-2-carboxylate reductase family protein [Albitalea sp.]HUG26020.1 delta(1)-pyrroline-2-carboxylate reductase family protein [Albitalea sp.]